MSDDLLTRYRFPGVDGAWWLGLRPLPLAWLAGVLTVTVLVLYAGTPLPVAATLLTLGAAVALVPIADRAAVEWLPTAARSAAARLSGRDRWRAPEVLRPATVPGAAPRTVPAHFGGQHLRDVAGVGVLDDRRGGIAVGVLAAAGSDRFALAEPQGQARLLDAWGAALAALAADPRIDRVQLVARAAPEDRDPAGWMRERADVVAGGEPLADYLQLVGEVTAQAIRHDVWVAAALDRRQGVDAVPGALGDLASRLLGAGLAARALGADELAGVLRRGFAGPDGGSKSGQRLGPVSAAESWEQVRTDDCWHRGYAVTGWPRLPLTAGWLEPLFLAAPALAARTVSVHLRPVAAGEAMRRARAARSRARLDAVDRARFGWLDSARVDADAAEAAAAEEELVGGYRLHRLAAVITVSAASLGALEDGCRTVRTAAETARLELRPLHGQHLSALRAALPVCRADGRSR